ncbi:WAT1-related protein At1g25270-like isoform X2 [Benincasa hispida]|uniref:WAT1-related protein At1g25270-like isoform X2 n=1 Tax=Benincasa hispida TaxID=102211 RepID=UPI0019020D0F|nr:WAT1-related protein At1g25270-like isoform X2 [Benincasa hispida]XP_038889634.1 WAT1-related protein At1g25270-like isoform X2 [Benincasa hispida]
MVMGLKVGVLVMIFVQISYVLMNVIYKLAVEDGMNMRVLVAYRAMFAAAFMLPLALLFERKSRPKLSRVTIYQAFLCGLLGVTLAQNLYIEGLALTSTTFAVAVTNLNPAFTFILAVCFRVEKLRVGTMGGKAKVVGTVVGIGGAMISTFYQGIQIQIPTTHFNVLHHNPAPQVHVASSYDSFTRRLLGSIFALASCAAYALWLIAQGKMNESYPYYYSSTALMTVMGFLQSLLLAICTVRDWNQWRLGFNIRLLSAAYSGIIPSGVVIAFISWCLTKRGPLFVSIFNPLAIVVMAIVGYLILDEKLHLERILEGPLALYYSSIVEFSIKTFDQRPLQT